MSAVGTATSSAQTDVGVAATYNFMDHKGGCTLMSLKTRRDCDISYKQKVSLFLEEKNGRRRRKEKKEEEEEEEEK